MNNDQTKAVEEAAKNPKNLGEMEGADAVGTVGRSDCGDMLRMWVKFKDENGRKVIDRATFQTFGCQRNCGGLVFGGHKKRWPGFPDLNQANLATT